MPDASRQEADTKSASFITPIQHTITSFHHTIHPIPNRIPSLSHTITPFPNTTSSFRHIITPISEHDNAHPPLSFPQFPTTLRQFRTLITLFPNTNSTYHTDFSTVSIHQIHVSRVQCGENVIPKRRNSSSVLRFGNMKLRFSVGFRRKYDATWRFRGEVRCYQT